jgi:integrase
VETRKRVESNLRCHLYPVFGNRPIRTITLTSVLEWLSLRLAEGTPKSSLKLYFELLDAVMAAAVTDKVISENPCDGVKLAQILRGLSRTPKWVPTETEVLALLDAVPARYRALIWLGAGQGCRLGEALGMEFGPRCLDVDRAELHVIQQLRYSPKEYGGFYLSEPKAGSAGTIDLDPVVGEILTEHVRQFPPVEVELVDITSGDPVRRTVPLLFTTTRGNPFTDRTWSREWAGWRDAAGWPEEHGTFHALRHFFATTLITNHAEPQEVQRLLRHKNAPDHPGDVCPLVAEAGAAPGCGRCDPARRCEGARSMLSCARSVPDDHGGGKTPGQKGWMVEPRGLEPLTPALQRQCSARLSYGPGRRRRGATGTASAGPARWWPRATAPARRWPT